MVSVMGTPNDIQAERWREAAAHARVEVSSTEHLPPRAVCETLRSTQVQHERRESAQVQGAALRCRRGGLTGPQRTPPCLPMWLARPK